MSVDVMPETIDQYFIYILLT